jgi:hypothetical protein
MIPLATWLDPKLSSPPRQPPLRPMLASTVVVPLASLFAARHVHTSGTPSAVLGGYFYHGPLTEIWAFSATPAEVRDRYQPFTITYAADPGRVPTRCARRRTGHRGDRGALHGRAGRRPSSTGRRHHDAGGARNLQSGANAASNTPYRPEGPGETWTLTCTNGSSCICCNSRGLTGMDGS